MIEQFYLINRWDLNKSTPPDKCAMCGSKT